MVSDLAERLTEGTVLSNVEGSHKYGARETCGRVSAESTLTGCYAKTHAERNLLLPISTNAPY